MLRWADAHLVSSWCILTTDTGRPDVLFAWCNEMVHGSRFRIREVTSLALTAPPKQTKPEKYRYESSRFSSKDLSLYRSSVGSRRAYSERKSLGRSQRIPAKGGAERRYALSRTG